MATPDATPTNKKPSHHLTLEEGSTKYGFVLVDQRGEINNKAIARSPIPPTGTKQAQGSTKYGDLEFPYTSVAQDDWSGGRGSEDFDKDHTRFSDSYRMTSRHPNKLMLGGQETYTTGYRTVNQYLPGNVTWQSLTGSTRYIAYKFTAPSTYSATKVYLWIRKRGSPGNLTVGIHNDDSGDPGTLREATAIAVGAVDTVSELYAFNISDTTLSNGLVYWVKIAGAAGDDSDDHWEVGVDAADTNDLTEISSDDSSWANADYDLYFRVIDNATDEGAIFFEYKNATYAVVDIDGSAAPRLYINGIRGIATGGSQATTTLGDSTQSMSTGAFVGGIITVRDEDKKSYIGVADRYWSTITANSSTVFTFSPAFTAAPAADKTEYVVVGDDTWTSISQTGLTGPVTDVAVFGDTVYFAQGDGITMRMMREYNSNGTWTREFAATPQNYAVYLKVVHDRQKGPRLWKANNRDIAGDRSVSSSQEVPWNQPLGFPIVVEDCEDVWTFDGDVTGTVDQTDYIAGNGSIRMIVDEALAAGDILGYEDLGASNTIDMWNYLSLVFWAKCSVDADEGDLQFRLSTASDATVESLDLDFNDMKAGVWQKHELPITVRAALRNIRSVGVQMVTELDGFTLHIDAITIQPAGTVGSYLSFGKGGDRINGLEAYGDPEEPWVFLEGSAGRINNNTFVPIPLREMENAKSRYNGAASTVHGVYLYFSFLQGIERYYRQNLDDVGPDRDEGLPISRQGPVTSMVGYPGRIFASIGVRQESSGKSSRLSSILSYNKTGWHEMYRAGYTAGKSLDGISALHIQNIPGWNSDRLWFNQGGDILWIPLPGNTLRENTDETYRFTHEGTLTSSWMFVNMQDVEKFYKSLKVMMSGFVAGSQEVEADYRTDSLIGWDTKWAALPSTFDNFIEEISLTNKTPPDITGRRLQYRLRLQTDDNTLTPEIHAVVLDAIPRIPVKYAYSFAYLAADQVRDLQQRPDSYVAVETLMNQVDSWANSATVLLMRVINSPYDFKEVLIDPSSLRPLYVNPGNQQEALIGQMTVTEI